jgi:hypothetical protein
METVEKTKGTWGLSKYNLHLSEVLPICTLTTCGTSCVCVPLIVSNYNKKKYNAVDYNNFIAIRILYYNINQVEQQAAP